MYTYRERDITAGPGKLASPGAPQNPDPLFLGADQLFFFIRGID